MMRYVRAASLVTLLATLGMGMMPALGAAAMETEVRDFSIEIDGKQSGQYTMTMTKQDDGILSMHGQANISFKHFWGTYTYTYNGTEHWKDGRLLQLTSNCNDDGHRVEVTANADHDVLSIKVNGRQSNRRWDVWTTTFWMLADQRFHDKSVPILDADTGKEYLGQLKYVGLEQIQVNGRPQNCRHFRVTGGPPTPNSPCELWYDANHRLVREEMVDSGKHVVFVLSAIRRQ